MTGFINVDKAEGLSSAREVGRIKWLTQTPCGHMGTLDPMASGVLPVAIGNAARLFDYLSNKTKRYTATFLFGTDSDTLDTTGEITERGGKIPSAEEINSVLPEFVGEIEQIPPKYSAKCVNGMRGYMLARKGVEFELSPKKVKIFSVELVSHPAPDAYTFDIECGGGTYIRSLARDLAARLGTCAVMNALTRTKSGVFALESAVRTENLTKENIAEYIIPTEKVLDYESIYPSPAEAKKLFNGLGVESGLKGGLYKIFDAEGRFYGISEVKDGYLKVRTKLC